MSYPSPYSWERTLTPRHLQTNSRPSSGIPNLRRPQKSKLQSSVSGELGNSLESNEGVGRTVGGAVKRRKHVVLLGLDGSGKTTILLRLRFGTRVDTAPTIGFNHEKVWGGGFRWSAWDVGGGEKVRPLWAMYARATDAIVFVVDASATQDSVEEARVELSRVVKFSKISAHNLNNSPPPVLVLANFQDRCYARGPEDIAVSLGLGESWASGVSWAVAPVCGLTGMGIEPAFGTLRSMIDQSAKERKRKKQEQKTNITPRWRW